MSANTKIKWTDQTWNPMIGCSKVSEGCRNCYAMHVAHVRAGNPAMQAKFGGTTKREGGNTLWTGKVTLSDEALMLPLKWRSPRRVFVNSMSDLFHESVRDEWIDRVFAVMALAPQHTFQLLTKRPERMKAYLSDPRTHTRVTESFRVIDPRAGSYCGIITCPWPLPNVWLGVSCEDQKTADERIPLLMQTPAAVRFISAEPLLGLISLRQSMHAWRMATGDLFLRDGAPRLNWVIVGGESGPGARPCDVEWVRSIVQECQAAGVACFVKQLGAKPQNLSRPTVAEWACDARLAFRDKKGGNPEEWPLDLRVRHFPKVLG